MAKDPYSVIALGFWLAACTTGSPPPAPSHPANAAWLLVDGTWAEYDYEIYGPATYNPITGMIDFDRSAAVILSQERQTNLAYTPLSATARVQSNSGTTVFAVPADLAYTLVEGETAQTIGETANSAASLINPPEPYIAVNPVPGEVIVTNSAVIYTGGAAGSITTRYETISISNVIDGFPDAVVTTLTENPGSATEMAYVWVFSGGEIAEEIIGKVNADNTITGGTMLKRIRIGKNP